MIEFALSDVGGASTGKSTLIHCLAQQFSNPNSTVFCAPTGKAARNITLRTGQRAYGLFATPRQRGRATLCRAIARCKKPHGYHNA